MGLHKPFDRDFFLLGGATMTSGRSLNLTKGQFGIFDIQDTNVNGAKAVSSFKGQPKNKLYELKLGKNDLPVTRSQNNKSYSSFPFKLENVLDLRVSTPERTEQSVDEVIVGYNGIDENTSLKFEVGDKNKMVVRLSGEPIGQLVNKEFVDIPIYLDAGDCPPFSDECDECEPCGESPCLPIVLKAIESLKNHQLRGGVKVSEMVDVTPIRECSDSPQLTEIPYTFYCLDVCDTGDDSAIALVQTQYPELNIERVDRKGAISSYKFLQPASDDTPVDFEQTITSVIKGCADCPNGYTEIEGGIVYAVTLEDEGADESATVEGLANAVASSAIKADAQNAGVGYYTVVLTSKLSDVDFETFIDANPTATITLVGEVEAICTNDTINTIAWAECGECNVTEQEYIIDVPDNECGENRLTELQDHYANLTIELEGTTGGCQTRYKTKVVSNLVCDECDEIFKDYYTTEAPTPFEQRQWSLVVNGDVNKDCLCGIRIKGKVLEVHPDECLRDELGFIDSSVKIQVSGGFITEVREGIGSIEDNPFHVEYLSRWKPRTHLGGNLWDLEDRSRTFFTGEQRHQGNVARFFKGEESNIKAGAQYVIYALTLKRTYYSQSFSGTENDIITYHLSSEIGQHEAAENLLNSLATARGLTPVQAFAK